MGQSYFFDSYFKCEKCSTIFTTLENCKDHSKYSQCGFETIFLSVQNIPCFKFDYFGWIICLYPLSDTAKCETSIENFEQLIQHQDTDHKMCKVCKVGKWSLENAESTKKIQVLWCFPMNLVNSITVPTSIKDTLE